MSVIETGRTAGDIRPLPEQAELAELADWALVEARRLGADQAEVGLAASRGLSVKVRRGEVDTLEHMRDRGFEITVYRNGCKGSASSSDYRREAIAEAVQAACDLARYASRDEYAGLADAALMAREVPDLSLHVPWRLSPEQAIERARECEAAALAVDPRLGNSDGADVSTGEAVRVYANSHGFIGGYPSSQHAISCVVLGGEGSGMQRDHWYSVARDPELLEPAASVGRRAGERTVQRLGARRIGTASVPVLFAPDVARSLIGHFVGAISGGSLYRRASFLLDSVGERLFPEFLSLREDPHMPGALGSAPFDDEGVATQPRVLVDDGVLQGYVLSSYSARRLGLATTGNAGGIHNLEVSPGERSFDELVADMGRGLIVTHLMGQGVNTVTGDYSRGASGFWVENGEIAYPVEEITVAGNLRDVFRRIAATGRDQDPRGVIRTGSILVERMTVAGE